ncbi:mitochondrial Homoaconitase [Puccinia graminis f. sp. tritici]|uniref:Mitochondrial Homoaconitase n=1 Tax=Puccinia graminis f. sp. tritici TaxID=56615 RepID=A0A5B0MWS3_PUCGR|nr:mitochondrial Homoaconitase [Puccinia graminis f. sp. tritici]KAA1103988.1 mitochondrial Homoaconitase [Puccinia graminis f. sp. tritici]
MPSCPDGYRTGRHLVHLIVSAAKTLPAGRGPWFGLGAGLLKKGEVKISTTSRNCLQGRFEIKIIKHPKPTKASSPSEANTRPTEPLSPSFPRVFAGPPILTSADNLNADGIHPGK